MHKLGIEIDENGHLERSKIKEQEREQTIKEETRFHIIRINPDKKDFGIDDKIGEIQDFIYESGIKLGEQSWFVVAFMYKSTIEFEYIILRYKF